MRGAVSGQPATPLGQLYFTTMSHHLYDVGLYRFVTPYIWRCATRRLMDNYVENISHDHLEIGVGSGYFLEHTLCADFLQRLVLLDLNRRCLSKSAKRLRALNPRQRHQNILSPLDEHETKHASVGMNYVLHCIPGSFTANRRLFKHVHSVLEEGGVFFGATLLTHSARGNVASWMLMKLLNVTGVFHNQEHKLKDLEAVLADTFRKVDLSVVGSAVVFRAVK